MQSMLDLALAFNFRALVQRLAAASTGASSMAARLTATPAVTPSPQSQQEKRAPRQPHLTPSARVCGLTGQLLRMRPPLLLGPLIVSLRVPPLEPHRCRSSLIVTLIVLKWGSGMLLSFFYCQL